MDAETDSGSEEDELASGLTPTQFGVVLVVLVVVLLLIRARRAR